MKRYPEYKESGVEWIGEYTSTLGVEKLGQVTIVFRLIRRNSCKTKC